MKTLYFFFEQQKKNTDLRSIEWMTLWTFTGKKNTKKNTVFEKKTGFECLDTVYDYPLWLSLFFFLDNFGYPWKNMVLIPWNLALSREKIYETTRENYLVTWKMAENPTRENRTHGHAWEKYNLLLAWVNTAA